MFKMPVSCLVIIYSGKQTLILERADHSGYWQSVTGSWENGETLLQTAQREVVEETGFQLDEGCWRDCWWANQYEIYSHWRYRYAPGICINTEHVFTLCLPEYLTPVLAPREHVRFAWVEWSEAANRVFSPTNRSALVWIGKNLVS